MLKKLLQQDESETLEFKTSFRKEVIETVVAFANTKGGHLIVGVGNDNSVIGVKLSTETVQNYINTIKQNTTPSIIVDIEVIEIEGESVLDIQVDEYPVKPVAFRGRYFKRRQNSNHKMSSVEISDAHIKMMNSSWDYYIDPIHFISDISEKKILHFMEMAKIGDDISTVYNKFELIKEGKITFGCYLLFTNNDSSLLTTIEIGRFASETIIKDGHTIRGDLLGQIERVMAFVYKHINKAYIISGKPQREERWDYPMDAIREVVVNMIVHRDYRSSGHTTVKIFDDRIEFFNFGALPDELTIEMIKSGRYKSIPRNLQIANIFKEAELIEKYGSGIKRVIGSFKAYGLREPVFEEMQGGLNVTVFNETAWGIKKDMKINGGINGGINNLLEYIQSHPGRKTTDLKAAFGLPQRTIERWLKQLKEENEIEFRGARKTGGYYPKK